MWPRFYRELAPDAKRAPIEKIGPIKLTLAYGIIAALYAFGFRLSLLASLYRRTCSVTESESAGSPPLAGKATAVRLASK
jgi:hypothetical protein